jgi:hypothetical protein
MLTPPLSFASTQVDACAFGLQHGQRAALTVKQRIVSLATIVQRVFVANAAAVRQVPIGIPQQLVNFDPCEGFIGHTGKCPQITRVMSANLTARKQLPDEPSVNEIASQQAQADRHPTRII